MEALSLRLNTTDLSLGGINCMDNDGHLVEVPQYGEKQGYAHCEPAEDALRGVGGACREAKIDGAGDEVGARVSCEEKTKVERCGPRVAFDVAYLV